MALSQYAAHVSLARRRTITTGLLLGMSLAALEATVVGTASTARNWASRPTSSHGASAPRWVSRRWAR
ncbi:MAG: hypothetical protein EXQ59_03080 [Acidobacteria bacterium]|nr:hypothetical protein [Acidobacteriota bacterium]